MHGQSRYQWLLRRSINRVYHYLHFDDTMVHWDDNLVGAKLYPVKEYAEWAATAYGGEAVKVLVTVEEV